jgi:hypothetical protein
VEFSAVATGIEDAMKMHPIVHGGYSKFPLRAIGRKNGHIWRYIQAVRETYISDLTAGQGEEALTAGQRILLDRLIQKISIVRIIENSLRPVGIFQAGLEIRGVLNFWRLMNDSIRQDIATLGLKRIPPEPKDISLEAIVEEYKEKSKEEKADG